MKNINQFEEVFFKITLLALFVVGIMSLQNMDKIKVPVKAQEVAKVQLQTVAMPQVIIVGKRLSNKEENNYLATR